MKSYKRKKPYYNGFPSVVEARPYFDREKYGEEPQEGDKARGWKILDQSGHPRYLSVKQFEANFMPDEEYQAIQEFLDKRLEEGSF